MTIKTTEAQQTEIVASFVRDLESAQTLAARYGMTRQGIYKVLKRHGVSPAEYGRLTVNCPVCGALFTICRARFKRQRWCFCSTECYFAWLDAGGPGRSGRYKDSRHGCRVARAKVSQFFELKPGHVVHHIDRNDLNNDISNLAVFASQADHMRHHRDIPVAPIWDGSAL